jgi:uncharacterized phage protein gp47/JayE
MRTRTTAAGAALLLAALAGCDTGSSGHTDPKATPSMAAPRTNVPSLNLSFGQAYTWPDGLKVSVTGARVFTDYDKAGGEHPQPGFTDFRVTLRLTGGRAPVDLGSVSTIVQGATNGGEAESATFAHGSAPLEGQLAPGVTTVKTDDESLETKYGRRIVVRVQRVAAGLASPEFAGTITG